MPTSSPSLMPLKQLVHTPPVHIPLPQSVPLKHGPPSSQRSQNSPPQSTPVSSPSDTPFVQAKHTPTGSATSASAATSSASTSAI